MRNFLKVCYLGLVIILLGGWVFGQSFLSSILGTVKDASGGVVPAASVTLTNVATGIQRTGKTKAEGDYYFGDLPPGTYMVAVAKEGFKEARSTNIVLTGQQTIRFDTALEVGSTTQKIEVKAAAPTLNTENPQLGDVRPREEMLNLPLNSRSVIDYFMLSSYNNQGDGSSYMLGGLRGNNTNFTIDGVTSNSAAFGGQIGDMIEETFDSIRDMKMLVSNNSAEYPNVATVLIESRSGTNQVHGSLFYYHSNNWLNANDFFANAAGQPKPKGPILNEFGGSFGGPVYIPHLYDGHNRTFFYFTLDRTDYPGEYSGTALVPTPKMQVGDFSELPTLPIGLTTITDPLTGNPFEGNVIPNNRISPVAQNLQAFGFPQPNDLKDLVNGYDWVGIFPSASHDTRYVTRVDHQLRASDALSARVSLRDSPSPLNFDSSVPEFIHRQGRDVQNAYLSETHTFSPTLLNEFRLAFARDASNLAGIHNGAQVVQQVGLQGLDLSDKMELRGVPYVNFVNFATMQEFPSYFWRSQTLEMLDNVTYVKGKHNLKMGWMLRHNDVNISEGDDPTEGDFGNLYFDGFATGLDYADFLLGIPHVTERFTRSQPRYDRYDQWGVFAQDNLRVSDKLTLNLGLRWEYFPPATDKYDMRYTFDLSNGNFILASQKSLKVVNPLWLSSGLLEQAGQVGYPERTLLQNNPHDFEPRIGFAYRPFGSGRTVIRGGFGIYYTSLTTSQMDNFGGGPFHSREFFVNNIESDGLADFQFPNPFPGVASVLYQTVDTSIKHQRDPYTQQWSLTVERELPGSIVARASYRGFASRQILYYSDVNKPHASTDPNGENFYTYPNFSRVNLLQPGGNQNMNALDVIIERKFSRGLSFQSGWTYQKNLSDAGDDGEQGEPEDPYNLRAEYGNMSFNPRHRWVSNLQYELPFGKGKPFGSHLSSAAEHVVGDWQIAAVTIFSTGQFLTAGFDNFDPSNTRTYGGRPDEIGKPQIANPSISQWFNPNAFAIPGCPDSDPVCANPADVGRFGNSARGVFTGPGIANMDFALYKYFTIREKVRMQFRATATNFLNHFNPDNPNTDISAGSLAVGVITGTHSRYDSLGSGARQIQIGLRFDF